MLVDPYQHDVLTIGTNIDETTHRIIMEATSLCGMCRQCSETQVSLHAPNFNKPILTN